MAYIVRGGREGGVLFHAVCSAEAYCLIPFLTVRFTFWMLFSLVPSPSFFARREARGEEKRRAWYPLFVHVLDFHGIP